jgi:predicted O-methyltransferase YrrM
MSSPYNILYSPLKRLLLLSLARRDQCVTLPWHLWKRFSQEQLASWRYGVLRECEVVAAQSLHRSSPTLSALPADSFLNEGVLSPLAALRILRALQVRRPQQILELGSGLSTLLFAEYAKGQARLGKPIPRVYSVEHDSRWLESARSRLIACNSADFVTFVHAPLTQQEYKHTTFHSYDYSVLSGRISPSSIDFALIDGPPGFRPVDPGRQGTLPAIAKLLRSDCLVVLDDAARQGERAAFSWWQASFPSCITAARGWLTAKGQLSFVWRPMQ